MVLTVSNVNFAWDEAGILNEVSLTVAPGEMVGLIGPNGAGKSTLLKLLAGIYPVQTGELRVDANSLPAMDARVRARQVAYLAQDRTVDWDLQVSQVVALGRFPHGDAGAERVREKIRTVLEQVDASHLIDRRVQSLSGGERARVLLARALVVEGQFLLVDEPVAELDPYHQLQVMDILKETAVSGVGVLAVLHDITLAARYMDRLVLLKNGQVMAEGTPSQVLSEQHLKEVYQVSVRTISEEGESFPVLWRREP